MLTKEEFHQLLKYGPLLLDGATGSNLQKAGMPRGCCTEQWILDNPQALTDLQRQYAEAGSRVLYAPTFQAQPIALERENLAAFGDGENDCGLLRFAGTGFAVENAVPACREAADKVVSAFDRAGVAEGIRWILEESGL